MFRNLGIRFTLLALVSLSAPSVIIATDPGRDAVVEPHPLFGLTVGIEQLTYEPYEPDRFTAYYFGRDIFYSSGLHHNHYAAYPVTLSYLSSSRKWGLEATYRSLHVANVWRREYYLYDNNSPVYTWRSSITEARQDASINYVWHFDRGNPFEWAVMVGVRGMDRLRDYSGDAYTNKQEIRTFGPSLGLRSEYHFNQWLGVRSSVVGYVMEGPFLQENSYFSTIYPGGLATANFTLYDRGNRMRIFANEIEGAFTLRSSEKLRMAAGFRHHDATFFSPRYNETTLSLNNESFYINPISVQTVLTITDIITRSSWNGWIDGLWN